MYIQFPDLTEVVCYTWVPKDYVLQPWDDEDSQNKLKNIKTEFAFGCASPDTNLKNLEQDGFKHLKTMTNWWPSHFGQYRGLKFLWYKNPKGTALPKTKVKRNIWCGGSDDEVVRHTDLAGTGCGFKIGERPLVPKYWQRFFTLMRLPLEILPVEKKWLETCGFEYIDSGSIAQYWINGFNPKEWSKAFEKAHWEKVDPKNKLISKKTMENYGSQL